MKEVQESDKDANWMAPCGVIHLIWPQDLGDTAVLYSSSAADLQ